MDRNGVLQPELAEGQVDLEALDGAPALDRDESTLRSGRRGSGRVCVADLSYQPMSCIDTLLVTFADD